MKKSICVFSKRRGRISEGIGTFLIDAIGYNVIECVFDDEGSICEAFMSNKPRCIVIDGYFGEGDEQIFTKWYTMMYVRELSFYDTLSDSKSCSDCMQSTR